MVRERRFEVDGYYNGYYYGGGGGEYPQDNDFEEYMSANNELVKILQSDDGLPEYIYGESALQIPKIGIVVPIYNVELYLRDCLDSILNQTYKNYEVLLIDDGSSDSSLEIAKEYVSQYSNFTLISKENGGQSSARNVGINYFLGKYSIEHSQHNVASDIDSNLNVYKVSNENPYKIKNIYKITDAPIPACDYIIFLDSDDYWDSDCLMSCIKSLFVKGAFDKDIEIVWFTFRTYFDGVEESRKKDWVFDALYHRGTKFWNPKLLADRMLEKRLRWFAWTPFGIVSLDLIRRNNISFVDNTIYEDHTFGLMIFFLAKKFVMIPEQLYTYRIRPNSSCNFGGNDSHEQITPSMRPLYEAFGSISLARDYYTISGCIINTREIEKFADSYPDSYIKKLFFNHILPTYCRISLRILDFKKDPLGVKDILKSLKSYEKFSKRNKLFLNYPAIYSCYGFLSNLTSSGKKVS